MLRTEGSQERLDNLAELKQSIYEYETTCGEESTLEHYLSHVALFTNADAGEPGDKVKLMTVHAAKGLEFPYVFLCGMNEGIFPSRKVRTLPGMEEERRLAFVALTRAEKGLYLSEADGRNFDGSPRYPSRFLLDIDPGLLTFPQEPREGLIRDARSYIDHSLRYLPEVFARIPLVHVEHGAFRPVRSLPEIEFSEKGVRIGRIRNHAGAVGAGPPCHKDIGAGHACNLGCRHSGQQTGGNV